jgi:hypothetical protein
MLFDSRLHLANQPPSLLAIIRLYRHKLRTMNKSVLLIAALTLSISLSWAGDAPKRKILFFSKSSGFEHSCIKVKDGQPSHADKVLTELGTKNNFEFTCTKDGSVFTPEGLAKFDAVFFHTTGDLTTPGTDKQPPMPKNGKETLLNYIKGGKGFIGSHCASDTFNSHGAEIDPYIAMPSATVPSRNPRSPVRTRNSPAAVTARTDLNCTRNGIH